MGASNSHEDLDQFTPPKTDKSQRVLPIDPRSPSGDITRTPIMVDKTPDGLLDGALDPRSPTVGISRTPLTYIPRHQTEEVVVAEVPKMDLNQDLTEASDFMPVDNTEEEDTSRNLLLDVADLENMSLDNFPTCESTRLVPHEEEQKPIVETEKLRPRKKKPKSTQPKELFPLKKGSGLKDVTRSPLSSRNVDMNSPLSIVQRKQIKDVDMKRNCSQESGMSRFIVMDKENM